MFQDVMSEGLLEDFPSLESPIECFMSCTHTALHQFILFRVRCTLGALDMKRSLANVTIISLYAFERIQKMCQAIAKNSNVGILTRWIGSLQPHQITLYDINPELIMKTAFPSKIVRGKWVALLSRALLRDSTVCSVNRQQVVVKTNTSLPILKYNLVENNHGEYFFALI
jgi:hypothetical protein